MALPKGSETPSRKGDWLKKGWVVKKVVNPVVCGCDRSTYPAVNCPSCGFYPCYADAYGSYKCPRCGKVFKVSAPTFKMLLAPKPAKACPICGYYPCYFDATCGSYKCPKGHLFQ